MHFDALTLAAVTAELNRTVVGGRVQQILMVDEHTVGMEIYADRVRRYLLLAAAPNQARVHLVGHKLRRGSERQSPFFLRLRKFVRGAVLLSAAQPDATERILRLVFAHAEHGQTTLVVEPMGRMPNLILLAPGDRILESVRRVRPSEHNARAVLPNQPYSAPPPLEKLPPVDDGRGDYYARLQQVLDQDVPLWRALLNGINGLSPSSAREIAWRAAGATDGAAADAQLLPVAQALQELWQPVTDGNWSPGVWLSADGGNEDHDGVDEAPVVGFSPYTAHVNVIFRPTESISAALEQFHAADPREQDRRTPAPSQENTDAYAGQRQAVAQALASARRKVERRLAGATADLPDADEIDELRTGAEWLLALSSQIEEGQEELAVELGEETLRIRLDPAKTPVEQAERMFNRAAKLERAAKIIPRRRAALKRDLAFLEQLQIDLQLAGDQPEIEAVRRELEAMGLVRTRGKQKGGGTPRSAPMHFRSPSGLTILVGRNARQNETVTFDLAAATDLWLHARRVPGSHVVIRLGGREADEESIAMAAQLAAYYSKARGERAAPVIVTEKRFVSRFPGGHAGQVSVRNDWTVTVAAELPEGIEGEDESG